MQKFGRYSSDGVNLYKLEKKGGMLRCPPAWTINLNWIDMDTLKKHKYILFKVLDEVYSVSVESAIYNGYRQEKGGEPKFVIPLQFWSVNDPRQASFNFGGAE